MQNCRKTARAKINLALHITGQRDDGYHLLDSVVVFSNYGDEITVSKQTTDANETAPHHLTINGPFGAGLEADQDNLVLKAARLMGDDIPPLNIVLEKNLPVASGIGGGSADAAATLLAIAELLDRPLPSGDDVLSLGADVPVCLHGCQQGTAIRMSGIGETLSALPKTPALPIVLVNPNVGVSTPAIFKSLTSKNNPPLARSNDGVNQAAPFAQWINDCRNDLQPPAILHCEEVSACINALSKCSGSLVARMSGSGATCFGLFENDEDAKEAASALQADHPNWWVVATKLAG
ncbi:MAG: 4-(cytidine 5'-diphospho)-2-C-methyl-D-erythritol kinase [Hyphomicrobiales bacterium]